jgi:hypothetical protein
MHIYSTRAFPLSYTTKTITFFRTLTTDLQQTMIILALSFEHIASTNSEKYSLEGIFSEITI